MMAPATTFESPVDHTATEPPEHRGIGRDGVRLLVAGPEGVVHTRFRVLPNHLRPEDLVVVNTSATLPAELDACRGATPIVLHLATDLGDGTWVAELRSAPDASAPVLDGVHGEQLSLPGGVRLELLAPYPVEHSSPSGAGNRLWRTRPYGRRPIVMASYLNRWGRPIAYGYLRRRFPLSDYQTVFASHPGSAEMPSAGRPFTDGLVNGLLACGVRFASITLHTGVSSQDAGEAPQAEWFEVPAATARMVSTTRADGGRVIAVGTTVTRALESAASADGLVAAASGWTQLVIDPSRGVRVVDGLITGWHNPEASHLLLVEAVAGRDVTQRAYDEALAQGYLWHEFGDSGLLLAR